MEEKVFHWTDFWNFRKKVSPVEDFECQSRGRVCPVERYLDFIFCDLLKLHFSPALPIA